MLETVHKTIARYWAIVYFGVLCRFKWSDISFRTLVVTFIVLVVVGCKMHSLTRTATSSAIAAGTKTGRSAPVNRAIASLVAESEFAIQIFRFVVYPYTMDLTPYMGIL